MVCAVALAWICLPRGGPSYVLGTANIRMALMSGEPVDSIDAFSWSRDVWPPGGTHTWYVVGSDPDWQEWFGSAEGAVPTVARALAFWSEIPSADISWRVEVGDFEERATNTISIDADWDGYAGAGLRGNNDPSGRFEPRGCVVTLGSWAARPPPAWWLDLDESERPRMFPGLMALAHEFGHCLGLGHTHTLPGPRYALEDEPDLWSVDPVMSYGNQGLRLDDVTGASLLRPRSGWMANTGGIAGRVHLDGRPVALAHVWAFPNTAEVERDAIGRPTRPDGRFVIEGLAPGDYTLWVSPITDHFAFAGILGRADPDTLVFDVADTVSPEPVRVVAGRVTEVADIGLRQGRQ